MIKKDLEKVEINENGNIPEPCYRGIDVENE